MKLRVPVANPDSNSSMMCCPCVSGVRALAPRLFASES